MKRHRLVKSVLHFEHCEGRRMLAPIVVNSFGDNVIGGDDLQTLREAILLANSDDVPDTILFDVAALDGQTITLTQGALPTLTESLTIDASPVG